MKNENIDHIKIDGEIILRNAKVDIINGFIMLICDENTAIYESKQKAFATNLITNYSKIKISKINYEIV